MQKVRIKLIKSKDFVEIMNKLLTSLKQRNNKNENYLNAQEIVRQKVNLPCNKKQSAFSETYQI